MSTNFFRKNDLKKNAIPSKALFKAQNTNVNVRLNNMGGNISKLNIQIDWYFLILIFSHHKHFMN